MQKWKAALVREQLDSSYAVIDKKTLDTPRKIFEVMKLMGMNHQLQEHFWVAHLNCKMQIIALTEVGIGGRTAALAEPCDVFREAILGGASAIVLIHNHPSGDPEPSAADIETTRAMAKAGQILQIDVVDHIIIGDDTYYSLRERGII